MDWHQMKKKLQERISANYSILWYKNTKMVAVRQKFGDKKQIFQWGGKKCSLDEAQLRQFGDIALEKLDAGESEQAVGEYIKKAVEPFFD